MRWLLIIMALLILVAMVWGFSTPGTGNFDAVLTATPTETPYPINPNTSGAQKYVYQTYCNSHACATYTPTPFSPQQ